jgi:hypothetical protein
VASWCTRFTVKLLNKTRSMGAGKPEPTRECCLLLLSSSVPTARWGKPHPALRVCRLLVSAGELLSIDGDTPHSMFLIDLISALFLPLALAWQIRQSSAKTHNTVPSRLMVLPTGRFFQCIALTGSGCKIIAESLAPHPGPQSPDHRPNPPGRWPTRHSVASNQASHKPVRWPSQARSQLKAGVVKPSPKI